MDAPVSRYVQPEPEETHVVELLRRASAAIDSLWRTALDDGSGDMALKLGEASHGVHRALIALGTSSPLQ